MKDEILDAEARIRPYVRVTPLDYSIPLSKITHAEVYLKCEHLQYTGAFKVRGAFNKLLSLTPIQRQKGIVTASSGNHGAAVAYGIKQLNIPGIVFVPEYTSSAKVENIHNYDAQLEFFSNELIETERHAREYAEAHDMVYISPYNDKEVVVGQGTIAVELVRQLHTIDAIFVPVGGGGLIAGIGAYIKEISPATKLYGCLPQNSPVMAESIKRGHIVEMETLPTLSDATAGGIEPGSITFDLCQKYVDEFILVSEDEIKEAIITMLNTHHTLIEGAAAVAVAALFKQANLVEGQNVIVILSGANISLETLKGLLI
jgi:threonine dehydratase